MTRTTNYATTRGPLPLLVLATSLVATFAAIPNSAYGLTFAVAVLDPKGGEIFSGGSMHDIRWYSESDFADPNPRIDIDYLVDGVPTPILSSDSHPHFQVHTYSWTVPRQDLRSVTIRACVRDLTHTTICDTSAPFRVDNTRPNVESLSPQGTNAHPSEDIVVRFSEPMNPVTLARSFDISPRPLGLTVTTFADGLRASHDGLTLGVPYTAIVSCGAVDRSDPGNAVLGCPIVWTFEANSTPPNVAWISPRGAERWSGRTIHEVRWNATDAEDPPNALTVYLGYSRDGSLWTDTGGPLRGDASYFWIVPPDDTVQALLRILVIDSSGTRTSSISEPFAIDATPPSITATSPADGQVGVGWTEPVFVTFGEAMDTTTGAEVLSVREDGGPYVPGTVSWESPTLLRFSAEIPYQASVRHIVRVNTSATDSSDPGNPMPIPFESSFVTLGNTPPTVRFTMSFPQCARPGPTPPEDSDCALSGGSVRDLAWFATDPEDAPSDLRVELALSSGGAFEPLAGPFGATDAFRWTVPFLNTTEGTLRALARDTQGATATDDFPFEGVDSRPPAILSVDPSPGAVDVPPDIVASISFSEPVVGSIGLRIAGGAWVPLSDTSNPRREASAALSPASSSLLAELTEYEIVVNGTDVRDGSYPGNSLGATAVYRFRTAVAPPVLAVAMPRPGARWSGGATQELSLSASDAHDAQVSLTVELGTGDSQVELLNRSVGGALQSFPVAIPLLDGDAVLRVCATDSKGARTCETIAIVLDARKPTAKTTPEPGHVVHPETPIVLRFSETMAAGGMVTFSLYPATSVTYRWSGTSFDNDTLIIEHPRLEERRTYVATFVCSLQDISFPGLGLDAPCPLSWSFATAGTPSVRLLDPASGERLTGGVAHTVRLLTDDEEQFLRTQIELSPDGGATWTTLRDLPTWTNGFTTPALILPPIDSAEALLRVSVRDSYDLTSTAIAGPFSIDATPPLIRSSSPVAGSSGFDPLGDIVLVFSESMSPSLEADLSSARPLGERVLERTEWGTTHVPFDTARISHKAIRLGAVVELALEARDASKPGNALTERLQFKIVDDTERPYVRLAVDDEAMEGDVVILDASGSSDNDEIVSYEWTIADERGQTLAQLAGARVEFPADDAGVLNVTVQVVDAAGNAARASADVEIRELGTIVTELPAPPDPLVGWVALTGGASATAWSVTDRARSFFSRMVFLPLYVKLKGPSVLDNELRGMIRGYVLVNPGDCYTDIKRNLQLQNGELAYHLSVLEREGIIKSIVKGAKRAYYPADMRLPESEEGLHEIQSRILGQVAQLPGMSVHDIAGFLGVSSQLALYHMRKLGEMGYLRFERSGMKLRVYATDEEERIRYLRMAENA